MSHALASPAALVGAAAVAWSLMTLVVDVSGASSAPFLWHGVFRLGASVFLALFLLLRFRGLLLDAGMM